MFTNANIIFEVCVLLTKNVIFEVSGNFINFSNTSKLYMKSLIFQKNCYWKLLSTTILVSQQCLCNLLSSTILWGSWWCVSSSQTIGSFQKKYNIGSFELLSKTAPIQALSLVILGPFVDYYLNGRSLLNYPFSGGATVSYPVTIRGSLEQCYLYSHYLSWVIYLLL